MSETVILSAVRSPIGRFLGGFSNTSATDLGSKVAATALEGIDPSVVDEALMGCVLQAGLGQNPARQIALGAGCPDHVTAMTINKVCGSGMQTVIMGAEALASGTIDYVVAGGMESMTNAPYLLKKHRSGARLGHDTTYDHMFLDGLEDAYEEGRAMGTFAQDTANDYQMTREEMDDYSIESLRRANAAIESGAFDGEVVPVTFSARKGDVTVEHDEQPGKGRPDKIPQLRPAFAKDGPFAKQAKLAMQFGSFQHDYAAEVGLGAFDDVLPFSQVQILEESKTYVQKNICSGDLEITIIDLDATADAPGPDKKKANASPGKVALHVFAAEA